jgi:hypothetical protein
MNTRNLFAERGTTPCFLATRCRTLALFSVIAIVAAGCTMGTTVSGTVFDPDGKPMEGATVTLSRENAVANQRVPSHCMTDAEGRFVVSQWGHGGDKLILTITKAGYARHKERSSKSPKEDREIFLTPEEP